MQVLSESSCDFEVIANFASRDASSAHLAAGFGESHVYLLQFEAGGVIGRHEAGFGQVLIVLAGSGWVSGDDGNRVEVGVGGVVFIERGEQHAKGSDTGMSALMVQVRDLSRLDGSTIGRPSGDPPE
jgi:quercetin dioxygenase-like cupin family protein